MKITAAASEGSYRKYSKSTESLLEDAIMSSKILQKAGRQSYIAHALVSNGKGVLGILPKWKIAVGEAHFYRLLPKVGYGAHRDS